MKDLRSVIAACLAVASGCGDSSNDTATDSGSLDASLAGEKVDAHIQASTDGSPGPTYQDSGLGGAASEAGAAEDDAGGLDGGLPVAPHDAGARNLNGFLVAQHCSPGDYYPAVINDCQDLQNGTAASKAAGTGLPAYNKLYQWWWKPDHAMIAGQPYAISPEITPFDTDGRTDAMQLEIWGTMSPCATGGEGAERLAVEGLDVERVYCHELIPTKSWTHVIFVFRGFTDTVGLALHGQGYCQTGTCPK